MLQECDISRKATRCLPRMPMELPRDLLPEEPDYFTADFNAEKAQMSVHVVLVALMRVSRGVSYDRIAYMYTYIVPATCTCTCSSVVAR